MVIIGLVLIAYTIYNNSGIQSTIPPITSTQTTALVQATETTISTSPTKTSTIPSGFTLTESGYSFIGAGTQYSPPFQFNNNTVTFNMTYNGDGIFNVWLLDQNHNALTQIEMAIVNGTFSQSQNMQVKEGVEYTLQIIGSGNWAVSIVQ